MKTIISLIFIGLLTFCSFFCGKRETTETKSDSTKVELGVSGSYKIKSSVNLYKYRVTLFEDTSKRMDKKTTYWSKYLEIEDTVSKTITFKKNCFHLYSDRDSTLWRVDLDKDGQYELIVFGIDELTSYVSEQCLIIDFKKKAEPILSIHNPELINEKGEYLITVDVRESPSVLMNGYTYCLSYLNGELKYKYVKDLTKGYCMCETGEDPEKCLKAISDKKEICKNVTSYGCFKMFILDKTLMNKESDGWQLFDKLYTCEDKTAKKRELKEEIKSITYDILNGDYSYKDPE